MMVSENHILVNRQEPAKILVLVPDLSLSGGVSGYYNTLKLDVSAGVDYFFVNDARNKKGVLLLLRVIKNYIRFFLLLIRKNYSLIHFNPSLDRKSFYRDALFIIIARGLGRKTLVFFRGWLDEYEKKIIKSKLRSFLFQISFAKANRYIVLSSHFKKKLLAMGVPQNAEFNIETTVADSRYVGELDLQKKIDSFVDKKIFLYLSRIEKEKGIFLALDAFKIFFEKNPGSCLIVAGEGKDLEAAIKYARDKHISSVEFLGHVEGEKKKRVLLQSHIMLFPSYSEGLPNCILEGMLYGMPVISRATGAIPDIIVQGENGYITESFEPHIFAEFMHQLACNAELYRTMAETNHRKAGNNYTTEKVRSRIIKIYSEC